MPQLAEGELRELLEIKKFGSEQASQPPLHEASDGQDQPEDEEPPVIEVLGANPAVLAVGATYSDNGARVTDNTSDNLGYSISLDGKEVTHVEIDTSQPGTHEIVYTATDQAGNSASATRTVEIIDPDPQGDQDDAGLQKTHQEVQGNASASTTPESAASTQAANEENDQQTDETGDSAKETEQDAATGPTASDSLTEPTASSSPAT